MPRLIASVEVWPADRSARIAIPGVSPTTYDLYPYITALDVHEALGDYGREAVTSKAVLATGCEPVVAAPACLSNRRVLKLIFDDASFEELRIVKFNRELSGEAPPSLEMEPIWMDLAAQVIRRTLTGGRVDPVVYLIGRTAQDCLDAIMESAPSHLVAGSAGSVAAVVVSLALAGANHLQALTDLCRAVQEATGEPCEWDYAWSSGDAAYQIGLTTGIGGTLDHPIEMGWGDKGNRRQLLKSEDFTDYFSRILPLGGPDEEVLTIAAAYWSVTGASYDGGTGRTTLTLGDDPIYLAGFPGTTGVEFGNATDGFFSVYSTSVPSTVVVTGDASGIYGSTGKFRLTDDSDLIYLSDPEAESTAGVAERVERRPDVAPVVNLLVAGGVSADLSDWSGGLPDGVQAVGSPTVTQVTDERYVQAGTSSADVQADAGEGIRTDDVSLAPTDTAPYASAWFGVRILSGSIGMELVGSDGASYPLGESARGEGDFFQGILLGGMRPPSGAAYLQITALQASTRFVLDSWTLTQTSTPYEWVRDMGPTALWHIGGALLATEGGIQPHHLEGEWLDYSYVAGATEDEAQIGGRCQIKDAHNGTSYGLDVEVRLVELTRSYAGQEYRKSGRFGSRAQDVTGYLVGHRRVRLLPAGGESLLGKLSVDLFPIANADGEVAAAVIGSSRVRSVKITANVRDRDDSEDFPTSADVYAETALNGQTHPPSAVGVLCTLGAGEVADIAAIGFGEADGEGDESVLTRLTFDPTPPNAFIGADQIADGNVIAAKLIESARSFVASVPFASTANDRVDWGAGTLQLSDGTSYAINSGYKSGMSTDDLWYIYFNSAVSVTTLQTTTSLSTASSGKAILLAVARRGADTSQWAFVVPAVGVPQFDMSALNDNAVTADAILAGSITTAKLDALAVTAEKIAAGAIETDKLAANAVTAAKINVVSLSAISADLGTVTAGTISANIIVAAESFTASNPEFTGTVSILGGSATDQVLITGLSLEIYPQLAEATSLYLGRSGSTDFILSTSPGSGAGASYTPDLTLYPSGDLQLSSAAGKLGFLSATPIAKPTVSGSRGGNAALASLLTALATYGLLTDSSS